MKKILFLTAFGMISHFVQAQVPDCNEVVVEYINAEGKLDTLRYFDEFPVSIDFIGSKGEVVDKNGVTSSEGETDISINEENSDCYVLIHSPKKCQWDEIRMKPFVNEHAESQGICIATHPQPVVSENILNVFDNTEWFAYLEGDDATIYIYEYQKDLDKYNRLTVRRLSYNTTYYVRPFLKFKGGYVMYGGEKTYTTPCTKAGALLHEPEMSKWNIVYGGNIIFKEEALVQLAGGEKPQSPTTNAIEASLRKMLDGMTAEEIKNSFEKKACRVLECTDDTLYFVDKFEDKFITDFNEIFHPSEIEIKTDNVSVNMDIDSKGSGRFTRNVNTPFNNIECDESWDAPYNSCMIIEPSSGSANPIVGFDVPEYLWDTTYSIYAVFVRISALTPEHIDDEESDKRAYRFYTNIFEKDENGEYPTNGARLENPADGSYYFVTNSENLVDTLYIGDYVFNGRGDAIIQFQVQIPGKLTMQYSREMLISKIYLVPKDEEQE